MPTYLNQSECKKLKAVVDQVMQTQFHANEDLRITYNTDHINADLGREILNGNYYRLHYPNIVCIVENLTVTLIIHIDSNFSSALYKRQV